VHFVKIYSRDKKRSFCLLQFFKPEVDPVKLRGTVAVPALKGSGIKAPPISGRDFEVQSSDSDDAQPKAIRSDSNTVIREGIATLAF
jgi:hypothetical protein